MKRQRWQWILLFAFIFINNAFAAELPLEKIQLPPGVRISVFAEGLREPRQMAISPKGTVFVGSRRIGKVYAIVPNKNFTKAKRVITLKKYLNMPNGVAFRDGDLYVAEVNRILRFSDIENHLDDPPEPEVITDDLPERKHHGWKYLKFGPDGWLYFQVGAPCNVCLRDDERFATIMRMQADGSEIEIFARGVRNTVGFDWDPQTEELWFTENGRDWMGDDIPPDELNHAPKAGLHFGFPYRHGDYIRDDKFGDKKPSGLDTTRPAQELGPHVAALGMIFYTAKRLPEDYYDRIFIAEHGSWNRKQKIGYRITTVKLKKNKAIAYEPFATGWLQGQEAWGRPVDILQLPDGALLVSDDKANVIYRIG